MCDDSTAQRRRGLQKHRASIFCIVISQSIVYGVLPRAHINDCWWHDLAHISDVVGYLQLILGRFFSRAHRFSHCTVMCMHYNGHV